MEFLTLIGNRIKLIRTASGYKQKDVAEKLGVQASLLSMYELGRREPSLLFLKRFCNLFKITLSQFFIFEENSARNKENKNAINTLNNLLAELEKFQLSSFVKK